MDEVLNEKPAGRKSSRPSDRVALGTAESEKVSSWLAQVNLDSNGFLTLNKSDVVNFLIRNHRAELLGKELSQIRSHYYDPIRHLNWITPRLKQGLASGDMAVVKALQDEIRRIELSVIARARVMSGKDTNSEPEVTLKSKRKRPKKIDSPSPVEGLSTEGMRADLQE